MNRREQLESLALRVEALTGPCRRVDALICIALNPDRQIIIGEHPGRFPREAIYGPVSALVDLAERSADPRAAACFLSALAFTASIDAAMTLVKTGIRRVEFGSYGDGTAWAYVLTPSDNVGESNGAPNEAAALTAASLRARAAQEPTA